MNEEAAMKKQTGWLDHAMQDREFRRGVLGEIFAERFLAQLEDIMSRQGITRSELANRMSCRPANITRLLRTSNNLTIASMMELADAVGHDVDPVLKDKIVTYGQLVCLPLDRGNKPADQEWQAVDDPRGQGLVA